MNFEQFKTDALRTESRPEKIAFSNPPIAILLTAGAQMARVMDTAKKTMFYGKTLDANALREQIEDLVGVLQSIHMGADLLTMPNSPEREAQAAAAAGVKVLTSPNLRILHGAIGMFGEAGELLDAVLNGMMNGELDLVNIAEETGDSDWYKAIILDEADVSEDAIRAKVIAKLKKRYGDKFTSEAALNRDLVAERAVLETTTA